MALLFSQSDWLPEYFCKRENRHACLKQIETANVQRFILRSCTTLRLQPTIAFGFHESYNDIESENSVYVCI